MSFSRSARLLSTPLKSYASKNPYILNVYASRNNTILTLSTPTPSSTTTTITPVSWTSAGSSGYKGASRGTYDAGVETTLKMFKKISDLINPPILAGGVKVKEGRGVPSDLEIIWNGFGQGREAVFRTLMSGEGDSVRGIVSRVSDAVSFLKFHFYNSIKRSLRFMS